jgi:membrane peptidoglycan carboxypeptidase
MDIVSQLVIASLFALHQYVPSDQMEAKYFETVVDPVTLQGDHNGLTILAAAHETCRHFFKTGEAELDFNEQELVGFAFSLIDQQSDNLKEVDSSTSAAKEVVRRVCQPQFDPQSFSREESRAMEVFIKEKIAILKPTDLDSTGSFHYFGHTSLYDRNGKLMGPLFTLSESWIPYSEISPSVTQALISAEDDHFLVHDGVYLGSLIRMAYNMKSSPDSNITGGSTITMQLLKNLYFNEWPEPSDSIFQKKAKLKTMLRKVREWYWAKVYEKYHEKLGPGSGKRFVLENYLNLMDFGPGVRGIDQAAHTFFNKTPLELNVADSAFIASLFKAPSRYSRPSNYEKYTVPRRKYVLEQMSGINAQANGLEPITRAERETALATALPVWEPVEDPESAPTATDSYIRTYAKDFLNNELTLPEGKRSIESELVTTIDSDLQQVVYDAVRTKIDSYDKGRQTVARVIAARDDRSRVAIASEDDISADDASALADFQDRLDELQINTRVAVYLGDTGDKSGSLKSFRILDKKGDITDLPAATQTDMQKAFSAQARYVGQILVAEIDPNRCPGLEVNNQFKSLQWILSRYQTQAVAPNTDELSANLETPSSAATEPLPEPLTETDLSATEEFPVPFRMNDDGTINVPLPRKRPDNADEIIAQAKKMAEQNRFLNFSIERRPPVEIPYAPIEPARCAHILNSSEMRTLSLWDTFSKTEDSVSKNMSKAFLQRMQLLAPRENLFPALYDGRNSSSGRKLVVAPSAKVEDENADYSQYVRAIDLSKSYGGENHANYFDRNTKNSNFRVGQVFWVSNDDNSNVFHLAPPKLQSAVVVMDTESGEVLANFGGYLPKTSKYFDRSRLSRRQPGSTLKPWLYYLAMNKGFEPYSMLKSAGVEFEIDRNSTYRPVNFDGGVGGSEVMLETAFIKSQNTAAVSLLVDPRFGPDRFENLHEFIDLLTDVGIYDKAEVDYRVPSTVLGTQEASILDMVSALTFFGNGQHIVKPVFFKSLISGQGEKLYLGQTSTLNVPYSDNRAALFQMQNLLIKVANSGGTAGALADFPTGTLGLSQCSGSNIGLNGQICFGGKTGTSSDFRDNWFMGISKKFVIGVWVGYDFPESTHSTGGALALPIFMEIVKNGQAHLPPIVPIIDSVPAGLHRLNVGNNQCLSTNGGGSTVYSKSDGSSMSQCMTCQCQMGSFGEYYLYVNNNGYPEQTFGADGGLWDMDVNAQAQMNRKNCQAAAQARGCQ